MRKSDDGDDEPIILRRAEDSDTRRHRESDAYSDRPLRPPHPGGAGERPRSGGREDTDEEDEEGVMRQLIPSENPKSLVAYYCGVFALIPPVGLVLGPLALLFGILGLRTAGKDPKGKGSGHSLAGIVLGPIAFLVSLGAVIGAHLYLRSEGVGITDLLDKKSY